MNNNNHEITAQISVWDMGAALEGTMQRLMLTDCDGFTTEPAEYEIHAGKVEITLKATAGIVLKFQPDPLELLIREK